MGEGEGGGDLGDYFTASGGEADFGDSVRLSPSRAEILSCMLNFPLAFSKPLMEGYMECRDGTPFLKERWGFVFIES